MKFTLSVLFLLVSGLGYSQTEELEAYKVANINKLVALFKQKDVDKISDMVSFPLRREYPIPAIKSKREFKKRFSEVFDQKLIDEIANSKDSQWSEVGWRGIMLDRGLVWIASADGKIIQVNYQSDLEKKLRKDLIAWQKEKLHPSLKVFENPVYLIRTKSYLIRVDHFWGSSYRYACWKSGEKESSKPDLIIQKGELEFEGTGGNSVVTFNDNGSTYRVYRNFIGKAGAPEIVLSIEKNGKTVLQEDGKLIEE